MDYIEDILSKIKDWVRRVIEGLFSPEPEPEPQLIPIPVDERRC